MLSDREVIDFLELIEDCDSASSMSFGSFVRRYKKRNLREYEREKWEHASRDEVSRRNRKVDVPATVLLVCAWIFFAGMVFFTLWPVFRNGFSGFDWDDFRVMKPTAATVWTTVATALLCFFAYLRQKGHSFANAVCAIWGSFIAFMAPAVKYANYSPSVYDGYFLRGFGNTTLLFLLTILVASRAGYLLRHRLLGNWWKKEAGHKYTAFEIILTVIMAAASILAVPLLTNINRLMSFAHIGWWVNVLVWIFPIVLTILSIKADYHAAAVSGWLYAVWQSVMTYTILFVFRSLSTGWQFWIFLGLLAVAIFVMIHLNETHDCLTSGPFKGMMIATMVITFLVWISGFGESGGYSNFGQFFWLVTPAIVVTVSACYTTLREITR